MADNSVEAFRTASSKMGEVNSTADRIPRDLAIMLDNIDDQEYLKDVCITYFLHPVCSVSIQFVHLSSVFSVIIVATLPFNTRKQII